MDPTVRFGVLEELQESQEAQEYQCREVDILPPYSTTASEALHRGCMSEVFVRSTNGWCMPHLK
jgi:hypothetical protein